MNRSKWRLLQERKEVGIIGLSSVEKNSPTHLNIFPTTDSDLEAIREIEVESFPHPWSENIFLKELSNPLSYAFSGKVSERGDEKLVGYIFFWIVHGEAHILNLTVHSDFRKLGFARKMLGFTLTFMEEKGVTDVFLEVRPSNVAAVTLYESFGFREFYVRKKYYGDEDALVMGLALKDDEFLWQSR